MKDFCMSSYLAFRTIFEEDKTFLPNRKNDIFENSPPKTPCTTSDDIDKVIAQVVQKEFVPNKTAIFLSGGIDSAIIASYLPAGTKAFTFKCIAEGTIDETHQAQKYADAYNLDLQIIDIVWNDFLELTPKLMEHDGMPMHSIEIMLYKAYSLAKSQGIEKVFDGNAADSVYGGLNGLLSKDWLFDDLVKRFIYLDPVRVLKNPISMEYIFEPYRIDNDKIDTLAVIKNVYSVESGSSYMHAADLVGIERVSPYYFSYLSEPLDLKRIRNGEPKYLLRELFAKKYPNMEIPTKIPMPRATDQWFANWEGPKRG